MCLLLHGVFALQIICHSVCQALWTFNWEYMLVVVLVVVGISPPLVFIALPLLNNFFSPPATMTPVAIKSTAVSILLLARVCSHSVGTSSQHRPKQWHDTRDWMLLTGIMLTACFSIKFTERLGKGSIATLAGWKRLQDDKQTTFKMLVFWSVFWSSDRSELC